MRPSSVIVPDSTTTASGGAAFVRAPSARMNGAIIGRTMGVYITSISMKANAPLITQSSEPMADGLLEGLGERGMELLNAFLAAILAVIHFLWLVKADIRQPVAYGVGVAGLLVLRLPGVRSRLRSW